MRTFAISLLFIASTLSASSRAAEVLENVAVMDFGASNAPTGDAATVTEFVRQAVVRSGKFNVVEKRNMEKILAEQAFQQTGCTSQECAVRLGKLLNVKKMIVGDYTMLGGKRFLTSSLVDVESGKIEKTGKVKGFDLGNADEAADQLVAQLTGVAIVPVETPVAAAPATVTPAAPARPPLSRARFVLRGKGGSIGFQQKMRFKFVDPATMATMTEETTVSHGSAEVLGGLGFIMPAVKDSRVVLGLNAGYGAISEGIGYYESTSLKTGGAGFKLTPSGSSTHAGASVAVVALDALLGYAVTDHFCLRVSGGMQWLMYPQVEVRYSQGPGSAETPIGTPRYNSRKGFVVGGGFDWFFNEHVSLELTTEIGGGFDAADPPADNEFTLKYAPARFTGAIKIYI